MAKIVNIALDNIQFETDGRLADGNFSNKVITELRNGKGSLVGKFVTTGVGIDEHQRRFKAIVKRTVKRK